MSTPQEVKLTLVKARDLIEPEENWCTGEERKVVAPGRYRYCAIGAVKQVVGGFNGHSDDYDGFTAYRDAVALLDEVAWQMTMEFDSIVDLNDEAEDHDKVIAAFDKAIERAAERVQMAVG